MTPQPQSSTVDDDLFLTLRPGVKTAALAVFLIIAADVLFWKQAIGLSLALFAALVWIAAAVSLRPVRMPWVSLLILVAGVLPVIEYVQALSVMILVVCLATSLVAMTHPLVGAGSVASGTLRVFGRVFLAGPLAWWVAVFNSLEAGLPQPSGTLRSVLRNWAFPLGGTLIFAGLMFEANPVIAQALSAFSTPEVARIWFWFGIALVIWPFIEGVTPSRSPLAVPDIAQAGQVIGINAASVLRALVMFNLLIAVQTLLDVTILMGGAALPDGMSFASYAHRGAYPLLATALLAGAFAIVARPHLRSAALIRPLMVLWLAQNVVLCASAALRLELYVAAYGLTYMRVYAFIWMGLVAVGLSLIVWQAWHARTTAWLMLRGGMMCLGTLYVCAFVNFASVIARHNLAEDVRTDWDYLCDLGPMAAAGAFPESYPDRNASLCGWDKPQASGWRDWQFRVARIGQTYIFAPSGAVDNMRERAANPPLNEPRRP